MGCEPAAVKPTETEDEPDECAGVPAMLVLPPQLDLLVVIDSSGTTVDEQSDLTQQLEDFVGKLEERGVDLQLAFTTTDAANPACGGPTGDAIFQTRSCRSRPEDFEYANPQPGEPEDAFAVGCAQHCSPQADAALDDGLQPTPFVWGTAEPEARPWVQWNPTTSNLPDGVDLRSAIGCLAPQGVSGCAFASPMTTIQHVLEREEYFSEDFFLRPESLFAVIVVTDELDCSTQPMWTDELLSPPNAFWDEADGPLSPGVCWRAGVECEESPEGLECSPLARSIDGTTKTDPAESVLLQPDSLVELIHRRWGRARCSVVRHQPRPFLGFLTGVPSGYGSGAAQLNIEPAADPNSAQRFGAQPSCDGAGGPAYPPVRLRALGEQLVGPTQTRNLYSVCDIPNTTLFDDLEAALEYDRNALCLIDADDVDPDFPEVQLECQYEVVRNGVGSPVTHCTWEPQSQQWLPLPERDRCYVVIPRDSQDPRFPPRRRRCEEIDSYELRLVATTPLVTGEELHRSCP